MTETKQKDWEQVAYNENPDFFHLLVAQDKLLHEKHLLESEIDNHVCEIGPLAEEGCECSAMNVQLTEITYQLNETNKQLWSINSQ